MSVGVVTGVGPDKWESISLNSSFLQCYIHSHTNPQLKLNHFFMYFKDSGSADTMRVQYSLVNIIAIEKHGNWKIK